MAESAENTPAFPGSLAAATSVGGRWDGALGSTLVSIAGMLEELTPEQWEQPSLCAGWRIRDVAGHIVWRIGSSNGEMLRSGLGAYLGKHINPMNVIDDLSRKAAEVEPGELIAGIRRAAAIKLGGSGRRGLSELTEAVVHGYDMAQPLGVDLHIPGEVTGAVAKQRAMMLPPTLRTVVRHRTLTATDAGWTIGSGPAVEGTAEAIVLYLFGRSALPDRRRN